MKVTATGLEGLQNNLRKFEDHARRLSRVGTEDATEPAAGSLPEEVVGLRLAQRGLEAGAAVLKTEDEMLGTLLDTFA